MNSSNVMHGVFLAIVGIGGAAAALAPYEPTWKILGVLIAVAGAVGNMLTASPTQAKRIAALEKSALATESKS